MRKMPGIRVTVFLLFCGCFAIVSGCTESGWSAWINNYSNSTALFPDEIKEGGNATVGGGDIESWTDSDKQTFCPTAHGTISNISCVTVYNETDWSEAQKVRSYSGGLACSTSKGFVCKSRLLTDGTKRCFDYKIRYYCDCTNPLTTVAPTAAPTTKAAPAGTTGGAGSGNNSHQRGGSGNDASSVLSSLYMVTLGLLTSILTNRR